jgi:hypothetical protein
MLKTTDETRLRARKIVSKEVLKVVGRAEEKLN